MSEDLTSTDMKHDQLALGGAKRPTSISLRDQMRRSERRAHLRSFALIIPLLLFLLGFFVLPIAFMLHFGIYSPDFGQGLPQFAGALSNDREPIPAEAVFEALARDLERARDERQQGRVLKPLRHQSLTIWTAFNKAAQALPAAPSPTFKQWFIDRAPEWSDANFWSIVRRVAQPYTSYYLLNSLDLVQAPDGTILAKPERDRVYLKIISNTFIIAFWVTLLTLVLGYPFAHLLATTRPPLSSILMALVLLPFWTSLLVRTYAWLMLLQTEGAVNSLLVWSGVVAEPLALIHNRLGVYIAMVHILLPFMILPIYSVMRGIRSDYMRAAASLGASPVQAFLTVYLPQSLPGVGAGCLLVFIFSLGFYITPALVGGARDSMISMVIAYNVNQVLNWGMAGALGTLLLTATLVVFVLYNRILGIERMRLN